MPKVYLLSFASQEFAGAQISLERSALDAGFDECLRRTPSDFYKTSFARTHHLIVSNRRGAGYWLWKPYYILESLQLLAPGDVLVYSDVGRDKPYVFDPFPTRLISLAEERSGFLIGPTIPQHGPISKWTKRDCLILLADDADAAARAPMVQATWSIWTNTPAAVQFASEWLAACTDPRSITDQPNVLGKPNYQDFVDHRHDQSVLSVLAHQQRVEVLDLSDTGIFTALKLRPNSSVAHTLMKSVGNVEKLLNGDSAYFLMLKLLAEKVFARGTI